MALRVTTTLRFDIQGKPHDEIMSRARERVASYFDAPLDDLHLVWSMDVHPFVTATGGDAPVWEASFTVERLENV